MRYVVIKVICVMILSTGLLVGGLVRRHGVRVIGVIGSVIMSAGVICSAVSPSVYVLFLTYGVVTGTYLLGRSHDRFKNQDNLPVPPKAENPNLFTQAIGDPGARFLKILGVILDVTQC